jgi:MYND finger
MSHDFFQMSTTMTKGKCVVCGGGGGGGGVGGATTKICGNCHGPRYCSRDCQVKDWPLHKIQCQRQRQTTSPQKENVSTLDHGKDEYEYCEIKVSVIVAHIQKNLRVRPLISVGSGNGYLESFIHSSKIPIICVDPDPTSYDSGESQHHPSHRRPPDFKLVKEMDIDTYRGKCSLFLGWPNFGLAQQYDLDAIQDLQPDQIYVVHEPDGGAGSEAFHHWLYENQTDYKTILTQLTSKAPYNAVELLVLQKEANSPKIPKPPTSQKCVDELNIVKMTFTRMVLMNLATKAKRDKDKKK